jgi:hypothetical protein
MGRHLAKTHLIDTPTPRPNLDLLYQVVWLQSWTRATTTQEYWVVLGEPSPDSVEAIQDPTSIPSATTLAFLQGLRDRETRFQEVQRQQSTLEQTGTPTYEGTRPWLDRTGWITTYQGVPRDLLKRLILLPTRSTTIHGLTLGSHPGQPLASPAID